MSEVNTAFLLIKPEACTEPFVAYAADYLPQVGIEVEAVGRHTPAEITRDRLVERHYAAIRHYATAPSEHLTALIHDRVDIQSTFFTTYGELWDAVVEDGRLLTARDAMTVLGNLSPGELEERWWSFHHTHAPGSLAYVRHAPVKLFRGFYVTYLHAEGLYIVNGFFPALEARFGAPPAGGGTAAACWMRLSWPESTYTWEAFQTEVIGTADPARAAPASLRHALYHRHDAWGLRRAPSIAANGLEVSRGPLEALAWHGIWSGGRPEEDVYGRYLLREGVPYDFLVRLLADPLVDPGTEALSAFELTAQLPGSQVPRRLIELYVQLEGRLASTEGVPPPPATAAARVDPATAAADVAFDVLHPGDLTEGCSAEAAARRNTAVILVKPHAAYPEVCTLVESVLTESVPGLTVDRTTVVEADTIRAHDVVRRHYGTLARYAMETDPAEVDVSDEAQQVFKDTYALDWDEALTRGRVWNARTALRLLGDRTAAELFGLWEAHPQKVKLTSGAYVCRFPRHGDVFVVNGFYPHLQEMFTAPGAVVHGWIVSWPERALSWADFRTSVIGATRPAAALPGSLRGRLWQHWQALGLTQAPNATENGLHASASPVEGFVERQLWFGVPATHDVLSRGLPRRGLSLAPLLSWASNPVIAVGEKDSVEHHAPRRVFDVLEHASTTEVLEMMRGADQEILARARAHPVNRALVWLQPGAVTERTVELTRSLLARAEVEIVSEGDHFPHAWARRALLESPARQTMARYASLTGLALWEAVPEDARERFREHFGVVWETHVGSVCGAEDAGTRLALSPTALMKAWCDAGPVKVGPSCRIAYLPAHELYVVNGAEPYLRARHTAPTGRVHHFEVVWRESAWSWADFATVVIGHPAVASSKPGSLQRCLAEEWRELGLPERPLYEPQTSITVSLGPLEAIADRARWLSAGPEEAHRRLWEDPLTQWLLVEGVPLHLITYHVALDGAAPTRGPRVPLEKPRRRELSYHQSSRACVRRMGALATQVQHALRRHHAFLWVQPSVAVEAFRERLPGLLAGHRLRIEQSGVVDLEVALERGLFNASFSALYRNAYTRHATEMPLSEAEAGLFQAAFGIAWDTAVRLSIVLNAREASTRVGETELIRAWEEATPKVCLSPSLYVGYLATEGLYVVNGFYPYLHTRLHTGTQAVWYSVSWAADVCSWEAFLDRVVGAANPSDAAEGSLRHHLALHWEDYGLNGPPDSVDTGVHVAPSPMEALAERCLWSGTVAEEDVLGRLLVQSGVRVDFLERALTNPLVYTPGAPVGRVTELFHRLPHHTSSLLETLLELQGDYTLRLLPPGLVLTDRMAALYDTDADAAQLERRQREALVQAGVCPAREALLAAPVETAREEAYPYQYALLYVSPAYTAEGSGEGLLDFLVDHLSGHGVSVVTRATLPTAAVAERGLFERHHAMLMRYAARVPGPEVLADSALRASLEAALGGAVVVPAYARNAVEAAAEFNLSDAKVDELWNACTPVVRVAPDVFVGKVPTEELYLVNGFALHSRNALSAVPGGVCYLVVSWPTASGLTYEHFQTNILGDPFVAQAAASSLHGVLRTAWSQLGLPIPPHPYLGVVQSSNSALQAAQQRQLWMCLGLPDDPLGRRAVGSAGVSPYIARWAMTDPLVTADAPDASATAGTGAGTHPAPVSRLSSLLRGYDARRVVEELQRREAAYRQAPLRNTAFVMVQPHALCRRFARRIAHIFETHHIRVDEEGDIAGASVHQRGLVRYLYPCAAGYAVRNPWSILLTDEELERVDQVLSVRWQDLLLSGILLNAYQALERLGDVSPQQLYISWKAARHRVLLRPHLELTELEEYGLYVVNGYFPALKHSFESSNALLHWYVVSWPEKDMSWAEFMDRVVGYRDPSRAASGSIRGQLFRHWRSYGLHGVPDPVQNGVHASEGPLQAMSERLTCLQGDIQEDPLGDLLTRKDIHEGLLDLWMDNPDVVSRGVTAGVFEHLSRLDTSRLIRTLEYISGEVRARQSARAAGGDGDGAPPGGVSLEAQILGEADPLPAPHDTALLTKEEVPLTEEDEDGLGAEASIGASWRSAPLPGESPVLYRNTALLLVKPHVSLNAGVRELLRRVLKEHDVRVVSETERESSAAHIDRTCFTEAFFAQRSNLAARLRESKDVSSSARKRFRRVFGESWEDATDPVAPRLMSAGEAMRTWGLSAHQLYLRVTLPNQLRLALAGDLHVVLVKPEQVYVVNGTYPYERQRMEQAAGPRPDPHRGGAEESNVVCVLVVAWDERGRSWHDFRRTVIGAPDPAQAAPGSFRAELLRDWEALGLAEAPDAVDNGVRESAGPLHAYAERAVWFGLHDLIPDSLVRSLCLADVDSTLLMHWATNPLVEYVSQVEPNPAGPPPRPTVSRLFDLLTDIDTRDLVELVRGAETHFTIVSSEKDLWYTTEDGLANLHPQAPYLRPARRGGPPATTTITTTATTATTATATATTNTTTDTSTAAVEASGSAPPASTHPTPQPAPSGAAAATIAAAAEPPARLAKPRERLQAARLHDALLRARTPEEVQQLWDYYVEVGPAPKTSAGLSWVYGNHTVEPTIDSRVFQKDFEGLETFGAPLLRHQKKALFAAAEARGGRMRYDEFARALAAYQTI